MKVFFDTNVILDILIRVEQFPDSLILFNDLLESQRVSLWISAISINNIEYIVAKACNNQKAYEAVQFLNQEFSIVPFRKSVFSRALNNPGQDFEDAIQIASAEELGMDYIITRNKNHFTNSKVDVATPTEFLAKCNAGEINNSTQVPFMNLKAQYHQVYNEIDDKITDVVSRSAFILGNYVEEFEKEFARAQEAKYCIGVSSGTDALHLALLALDIGPGDAVFLPVNTFFATAEAVFLIGATPVFVDIDPQTYHLDPVQLEKAIQETGVRSRESGARPLTPKGIIPVHLYGQPADMDRIMDIAQRYGLEVVEDCAQSHLATLKGKKTGNFGSFGAFSFYPGKNLGPLERPGPC